MATPTKGGKVLIVDDNEHMAKCLADMVDFFRVPCETVSDGSEAIERLKHEDYSLVIADTRMPKISGFTLLKYIKKNYPETPVAIISTRNSQVTQGMVVKDGPDFYLPKPFKSAEIERILSQVL